MLVTAAPDHVSRPLLDDLAVGARLVIPVGSSSDRQRLDLWSGSRLEEATNPSSGAS